ncbi:MAG: NAD-dependent epimerase/dehydratase family protein [Phycisphaera sp.]|nr:MAG: NAD-dependent epimerase/dehydratase family protein [Phycisphaera sp.]
MREGAANPTGRTRRVLVTGGAGFIGSHLVERLLSRGDSVVVVDDLSTGIRTNLPESHSRLAFRHADLRDWLHGPAGDSGEFDEIYHMAAAVGVELVIADPIGSIETNTEQTSALLRYAARGKAGAPAVLIASSSEVYGKSERVPFHEDDDVVYGPTTATRWSYACSKALDEYLALAHHRNSGLGVVVARLFNTVGPRQVGRYGMVLPRFVSAALSGEPLRVFGDGEQVRCFCDVRDVSRALVDLVGTAKAHGRIYNVGSEQAISIFELARTVVEVLGSASDIELVPYDKAYGPGFEDLRRREPHLARLRQAIDFEPEHELNSTILAVAEAMGSAGVSR